MAEARISRITAKKSDRIILAVSFSYLLLPIIIFLFGWLKTGYAIGSTAILIAALFQCIRNNDSFAEVKISRDSVHTWLVIVLMAFAWVYFSGIGGFSYQNWDFHFRNATLRDLIDYHWPVIYDYTGQPAIHNLSGHKGALVYYLTFWMPSAISGKLWGWKIANIFLYFYSAAGVLLFFYLVSRYLKKLSAYVALLCIFWSGLDIVGWLVSLKKLHIGQHIEWWARYFQYSSHTSTLFWVFNQAIPAWIVLLLVLNQTDKKSVIFTYCLALPFAPLPCIGMAPFIAYYVLRGKSGAKNIKQSLSFQNIAAPLVIAFIFGTYYLSNNNSLGQAKMIWFGAGSFSDFAEIIAYYVLFCFLEFGLIALLLAKKFRKEPLFIIAVVSLMIIPLCSAGRSNDFAMRASIPALLVLTIYTARWFAENTKNRDPFIKVALICCLIFGAITPANEFIRSIKYTIFKPSQCIADDWKTFSKISKPRIRLLDNFIGIDPEKTFFFKTLSKAKNERSI